MKNKIMTLLCVSVFLIVALTGFTTADLTLTEVNIPANSTHGTTIEVQVSLTADDNYTSLNWSTSDANFDVSELPTEINESQILNFTIDFIVPMYEAPGAYSANLNVINNTIESNILEVEINIEASNTLTITSTSLLNDISTLTIKNTGNTELTQIILTQSGNYFNVDFSNYSTTLPVQGEMQVTATIISELNDLIGDNRITITATSNEGATSQTILTKRYDFCEYLTLERLKIRSIDFNNQGIFHTVFGKDDEWNLFEEIQVTIEVENDGKYDMQDIQLEWGLYNDASNEWVIDVQEEDSDFNLDSNEKKEIVFTLKLDTSLDVNLEDLTKGKDYVFYAKAIGEIDDSDSSNDEESTCAERSEAIEVKIEKNFVVLDDLEGTYDVSCGSELIINADIFNTRSNQDGITLIVKNNQLGIFETIAVGDIDEFDNSAIIVALNIPEDAKEGMYELIFGIFDEDNDLYEVDNTETEFSIFVNVVGSCEVKPTLQVEVILDEEVKEGEVGTIIVTITNLQDTTIELDLDLSSYSSWAKDMEFVKGNNYAVIKGGETKEVTITFTSKDDSFGSQTFDLILTSEEGIETQPLEVKILEDKGFFSFMTGFATGSGVYTTGLTGLIIVLIVIILTLLGIRKLRK